MRGKYKNSQARNFLDSIPTVSIESDADTLSAKCKFNFAYFTEQPAGQTFGEWSKNQQTELLHKLKEYSKESLPYWIAQRVLVVYGTFPKKSDFTHPKSVPFEAQWARFRLESAVRLVGFLIPGEFHQKEHPKTKCYFDKNTFYVVFLDQNHLFYKTEPK